MSEDNVRRFFETIASIISEREKVKATVEVSKKRRISSITNGRK